MLKVSQNNFKTFVMSTQLTSTSANSNCWNRVLLRMLLKVLCLTQCLCVLAQLTLMPRFWLVLSSQKARETMIDRI